MKTHFTVSVHMHQILLIGAMITILFPLAWSFTLSVVHFASSNIWTFDWLIALEWLGLESIGIGLLIYVAWFYRRYIRRTLWTFAIMILLLVVSLIYAAMTQMVNQGVVQWETLDLVVTGSLLIAFHITLGILGLYAYLLLNEIKHHHE